MVNYGEMLALVEEVYLKVCLGFGSFKVKNLNYTWSDFVFFVLFYSLHCRWSISDSDFSTALAVS